MPYQRLRIFSFVFLIAGVFLHLSYESWEFSPFALLRANNSSLSLPKEIPSNDLLRAGISSSIASRLKVSSFYSSPSCFLGGQTFPFHLSEGLGILPSYFWGLEVLPFTFQVERAPSVFIKAGIFSTFIFLRDAGFFFVFLSSGDYILSTLDRDSPALSFQIFPVYFMSFWRLCFFLLSSLWLRFHPFYSPQK